jgi:hypothetical protein
MEWLLLILTMIAVVTFATIVARYVIAITDVVIHFGAGKDCDLAKICWGVRAIDKETGVLPSGIPELNNHLVAIRDGLVSIDRAIVTATVSQQ